MMRIVSLPAVTAMLLGLTACGGSAPTPTQATLNTPESVMLPPQQANGSTATLFTFGKNSTSTSTPQGTGIQVNAYIWRATLDTLSFMPLVSADPFGGVVITDWYSPPATPNERFKANAYILSSQMDANAIKISLFHQILQNGQWQDADVDPNTVSGLEDRILARAADLKAEAENTRG
jgi:hypothetical protein